MMDARPLEEFRTWAARAGLLLEGGDAEHLWISFEAATAEERYWDTPYDSGRLLFFSTVLLDALDPWEYCWAIKRVGAWSDLEREGFETVLRGLGIPERFEGALRFSAVERASLTLLIAAGIAFGWCGYYDF